MAAGGSVIFRRKLPRDRVLSFLADQPRCIVAMEAGATCHDRGRGIERLGHSVRLIPPVYVKPFVKRQKNDAVDAEAIAEAASRPAMIDQIRKLRSGYVGGVRRSMNRKGK